MTEARLPSEPHLSRVAEDDDVLSQRPAPRTAPRRSSLPWVMALVLGLAALVAVYAWWRAREAPVPAAPPVASAPPPAAAPAEPAIRHPIGDVAKHAGLDEGGAPPATAALADSDAPLRDALTAIPGMGTFERFVHPREMARRFVATVDNLPRPTLATQVSVVKPIEGTFAVAGPDGQRTLAADNAARYEPFVRFASGLDTKALVGLYVRFYPWFQQAYVELGYPTGYFNDRLVEVIDHLLAAPDLTGPIALEQPRVLYQFADPRLEALSAGQKMMIRLGSENAARAKAKLREVRSALTGALPPA